jgi:hypothetical protein
MILVTCIISTLVTEKAARRIVIEIQNNEPASYKSPIQNEQILIPVANPDTMLFLFLEMTELELV